MTKRSIMEAMEQAQSAAQGAAPSERERLLTRQFQVWEYCREQLAQTRKEQAERLSLAVAALRVAIEAGVPPGDASRAVSKLVGVENAWQLLEEAKAERAEAIKGAKEDLGNAESRLREMIENVRQLTLFAEDEEP
jgi:hypothetical protein